MSRRFVQVLCDIDCDWEGLPPNYRVYVNDELFAEREFRWSDSYLEENLQLDVPVGRYHVTVQPVGPSIAKFHVSNRRIEVGRAMWVDDKTIEVVT